MMPGMYFTTGAILWQDNLVRLFRHPISCGIYESQCILIMVLTDSISSVCSRSQCDILEFILALIEGKLGLHKPLLLNLCGHLERSLHFFGMQFHNL